MLNVLSQALCEKLLDCESGCPKLVNIFILVIERSGIDKIFLAQSKEFIDLPIQSSNSKVVQLDRHFKELRIRISFLLWDICLETSFLE